MMKAVEPPTSRIVSRLRPGAEGHAEGLQAVVPETKNRDELSRQRADDPRRRSERGRG